MLEIAAGIAGIAKTAGKAEMLDTLMNDDAFPFTNQPMIKTMRRELTAMLTKQHEATGHMHLPNTRTIDSTLSA